MSEAFEHYKGYGTSDGLRSREATEDRNMNAGGQIAVTLAGLIGFGRIFLADEGAGHRLSGCLILAGLIGKIALSI
jgi:hypothetical protein